MENDGDSEEHPANEEGKRKRQRTRQRGLDDSLSKEKLTFPANSLGLSLGSLCPSSDDL